MVGRGPGRRRWSAAPAADISYGGAGRADLLDIYRHRSRPPGAPVLIHLHGGALVMGRKNREARPLLYRLASQGWVCVSAHYRLRPAATFYGEPGRAQQSPWSPLSYDPAGAPPFVVAHGDRDSLLPVQGPACSPAGCAAARPVVYAELPGGQHGFDRFHSLRFEAVVEAVEAFTAWVRSRKRPAGRPEREPGRLARSVRRAPGWRLSGPASCGGRECSRYPGSA